MGRSAAVTGEVRQLVAEKHLTSCYYRNPMSRTKARATFFGLRTRIKVAALGTPMGDDSDQQSPTADDIYLAA